MAQPNDNEQQACDNLDSNGHTIQNMEVQETETIVPRVFPTQKKLLKSLLINVPPTNLIPETQKLQIDPTATAVSNSEIFSSDFVDNDGFRPDGNLSVSIDNFSNLKETTFSPLVYIRNLPWRIMVVPREANKQSFNSLGIYLQCYADCDSTSWSCQASAQIKLLSFKPDAEPFIRNISHLFYCKENDWGYSNFLDYNTLLDPNEGYIQNDKICFEAFVKAEVPHGMFWDSKKYTGYIGLKNQGATCYMNSLLQTLYFTCSLRKAVYKIPTEADDSSKSVALALQRVFYDLQFSDDPVGTKKLTKSFGWEANESFLQHDIQEFLRVLLDKLETEMKGTSIEYSIPSLFEGKMISYIKCINIDYESKRLETFYDIQLNIKGKKNIDESFKDYVKAETLEDKYDAGKHGFQQAEKGVKFKSFPPVLYLHLMRFQFDPITNNSMKFNDRFEFYDEINLDPYLSEIELTPATYKLYAVLVHSGDNQGGHYVVYINPKVNGKWCKFDDQIVTNCTESEAIECNYGNDDTNSNNSSAYMLVYIRVSAISRILEEVTANDIPSELTDKMIEEKRLQTLRRIERSESSSFIHVHIVLEEFFECHQASDLYVQGDVKAIVFRLRKTQTMGELFQLLIKSFKVHSSRMRLWKLTSFSNLIRPLYLDIELEIDSPIEKMLNRNQSIWEIYLQKCLPDQLESLSPFVKNQHILLFFKYYDAVNKRLNYLGSNQYSVHERLIDILPQICTSELPELSRLIVYEESQLNALQRVLNLEDPIQTSLLVNGNGDICGTILVLEEKYPNTDLQLPTCEDYFKYLICQADVVFENKMDPTSPVFQLKLSKRCTYDELAVHVAEKLEADPLKIQFFKCLNDEPGFPIKSDYSGCLRDLLACNKPRLSNKIFYQFLSLPLIELENKKQFKCLWLPSNLKDEKELILYPNINENVKALLDEAASQIEFNEHSTRKLRLLEINEHKVLSVINEETQIASLSLQNASENKINHYTQRYYRIEEHQADELEMTDNDILVSVIHFNRDINNSFGNPFLIKISHNENFGSIKSRIKKRLSVLDKDWEKYKFTIVSMTKTENILDDNYLIDLEDFRLQTYEAGIEPMPYIGLDHINVNKSLKRTRYTSVEKSIKIYN